MLGKKNANEVPRALPRRTEACFVSPLGVDLPHPWHGPLAKHIRLDELPHLGLESNPIQAVLHHQRGGTRRVDSIRRVMRDGSLDKNTGE